MMYSIIIPVLNESEALPDLLGHLQYVVDSPDGEIIFVDGGSTDDSFGKLANCGHTVLHSDAGRARQLNAGAAVATGDILFFLHADTRLPPVLDVEWINSTLEKTRRSWGRFNVQIEGRSRLLPAIARLMNLRSRLSGIATGDQCLFIKRDLFQRIGGFPDQPIMEDIEICTRLRKFSAPLCLRHCVTTSGRRWDKNGAWRTSLLMWRLRWLYWRGQDPAILAQMYRYS